MIEVDLRYHASARGLKHRAICYERRAIAEIACAYGRLDPCTGSNPDRTTGMSTGISSEVSSNSTTCYIEIEEDWK